MRIVVFLLWVVFATVMVGIAYEFLLACDLSMPVFGFRYCQKTQAGLFSKIETQAERKRSLKARLHDAEIRAASLPVCQRQEPQAPPPERLTMPGRVEDLRGCWQSDRGDTDVFTDDEAMRFIAKRRTCLCFDGNGEGRVRMTYDNGAKCDGPLTANLQGDRFTVRFPNVPCSDGSHYVSTDVVCTNSAGAASCDWRTHGYRRRVILGDKYHRVEASYCEAR
jgi:hypothetical protein